MRECPAKTPGKNRCHPARRQLREWHDSFNRVAVKPLIEQSTSLSVPKFAAQFSRRAETVVFEGQAQPETPGFAQ